jgi:amino acid adenylation domain-containing protein
MSVVMAGGCFQDQVRAQAARTPHAVAVEWPGGALDYAALEARSNRLARALVARGVGREAVVGVAIGASPERIVAMLAVWKAGGACLPLDAGHPRARIALALDECEVALVVTEAAIAGALPLDGRGTLLVDGDAAAIAGESAEPPEVPVELGQLAYVLYTSGSTGRPKGVAVEHRGLAGLRSANVAAGSDGARRVLAFASPTFDASLSELVLALAFGGTLCIPPSEARAGAGLVEQLERARIDCVVLPPSTLAALPPAPLPDLKIVISAGEVCPQALVDRFAPGRAFFNHYGPTEASVWSTVARCAPGRRPTLGRAIAGVETWVLDGALHPVREGEVGELFIGGTGVARGYHRQPSLTAARFVANPFGTGRLFKSGDRVRLLPGGELDFVGRADRQLKVRGIRIDPVEIEEALSHIAAVREAAVVADGERLVAYVVASAPAPAPAALRADLSRALPASLVPASFAYLDALPRTPNGKVDFPSLPPPERAMWRRPYLAPGSGVPPERAANEAKVAALFVELLGCGPVGADEDFFELGGHSLLAARLLARLAEALGATVPLAAFLAAPTVRGVAQALAPDPTPARPHQQHNEAESILSSVEERLLFVDALEPGLAVYNTPLLIDLAGPLAGDVESLTRSVQALVRRHAVLRDAYRDDGGAPRAVAGADDPLPVALVDLRRSDGAELARRIDAEVRRPFDPRRAPLVRATIFRRADDQTALLVTLHHLVFDGWSSGVFVRELLELHAAFAAGRAPSLTPLALTYRNYAADEARWLASGATEPLVAWWRTELAGARAPELPTDRAPPPSRTHPGLRLPIHLDRRMVDAIDGLAREAGATPFMVLLAAFQALLARHSGEEEITVGAPVAGRGRRELEPLVGCFVNTVALRTSLAGAPSFRALVARVRDVTRSAWAHQELPFQKVIAALNEGDRSAQSPPLVRAMLVLDDTPPAPRAANDLAVTVTRPHNGTAMFDLTLAFQESPDGLDGYLECDLELFDPATAARLADRWVRLLVGAVAEPDRSIAALPLSTPEEERLLAAWNDTARPRAARCAHELFTAQAAQTPDAPAVISGCATFSYREIDRRSNQVAHWLRGRGVTTATRVGIAIEESADKAVAVLAVLKAGAACVPLDPSYPRERLEFMQRDAGVTVVLGREGFSAADGAPDGPLDGGASLDDLIYVLYTSGSTGRPKGVALPHRALSNLVAWHADTLPAARRTLQFSPLAFDASFHELFAAWAGGGAVVMADPRARIDMRLLAQVIDTQAVDKVILPVVVLHQLAEAVADEPGALVTLRDVMATGERLRITPAVVRLFTRLGECRLHNHYGPSETHVVTAHTLTGAPAAWPVLPPIGRPIDNTRVYVVDAAGRPAPLGVAGELLVGGDMLARGYLERPALTAARFVPHPFDGEVGGRLYRTGDLARWRSDGTLAFLGRIDHQLKIRGFRVEPGEVEAILCEHPRVRHAAVVAHGDRLVAYLVLDGDAGASELRDFAARRLPDYMVPAAFTAIPALPRTPSGKIDPRALPPPVFPERSGGFVPARNATEERIAAIWAAQLEREPIGATDNFFELGGHSLIATRVMARIAKSFGIILSPRELFDRPTVAAISARIEELLSDEIRAEGRGS